MKERMPLSMLALLVGLGLLPAEIAGAPANPGPADAGAITRRVWFSDGGYREEAVPVLIVPVCPQNQCLPDGGHLQRPARGFDNCGEPSCGPGEKPVTGMSKPG